MDGQAVYRLLTLRTLRTGLVFYTACAPLAIHASAHDMGLHSISNESGQINIYQKGGRLTLPCSFAIVCDSEMTSV